MFKLIFLLTRKQGTSSEQFYDYYETTHREFIMQMPNVENYVRRYLKPLPGMAEDGAPFDAITELWFKDEAAYRGAMKFALSPEFQRAVAEDEEQFLDRSKTRALTVDERSW